MSQVESARDRRVMPSAATPEVRVVATARQRLEGLLDHAIEDPPEDPTIAEVVTAASAHPHAESWMIAGGEPTLRADFPQLIRALADAGAPRLGMVTDGLALAAPGVPGMLAQLGLSRVRIRLAGARQDAHDWLMGQQGAWRRALKAVKACVDAGLETEVECTLTRPTRPYTEEAMELFARLGVRAVVLRRVTARGPAAEHDVTLMPRFGLMQKDVETGVQTGVRRGLTVLVEGFPLCALPGVAAQHLEVGAVVWALPSTGRWAWLAPRFDQPDAVRGCGMCPGPPRCAGAPSDYTGRFGRTEIDSEGVRRVNPGTLPATPLVGGEVYPPPRLGRFPATRLSVVRASARLPSLAGDPLVVSRVGEAIDALRCVFLAPSSVADPVLGDHPGPSVAESSRAIRTRLVEAAQHGAKTLRLVGGGTLAHPDAAELLREATRLQFPHVEVAGEGSPLDALSDMQLRRLRGISRVDVALYDVDPAAHDARVGRQGAFEAALRALDRLGGLVPSIELGCYAVLTSPAQLAGFAEAWDAGDLPGEPWFRLAPIGGSLVDLAREASKLPPGPARDAIARVLPVRLFDRPEGLLAAPEATIAWGDVPSAFAKPSGSDRFGCYTDRPSPDPEASGVTDPGYAVGWTSVEP